MQYEKYFNHFITETRNKDVTASETWCLNKDSRDKINELEMCIYRILLKKTNTDQITNREVMHGTTRIIIEFHPNVKIPVFRPSSEITKLHKRESERNEEEKNEDRGNPGSGRCWN